MLMNALRKFMNFLFLFLKEGALRGSVFLSNDVKVMMLHKERNINIIATRSL